MKIWKSLSRQAKLLASAGIGFIFLCGLCAVAGIFISGSQSKRTSQEDLVQTVMVETILHIQKTEDAKTSTLDSLPTVAETSTETNSIPLGSVNECVSSNSYEKGTVVEVVDGDTIRVQVLGEVFPVRYIGIDTPDNQGSDTFTSVNSSLVLGKEVFLFHDISDVDQFGRLLRYVYVGDIFVNYELVRRGYADATAYPPDTSCQVLFNSARTQAQSDGVGIWQATPTVPVGSSQALIEIIAVNKEEEYVDIQNIGNQAQNLSGWYLVSERGNQTCYLSGNIGPGEVLRIWAGSSNSGGFSCGFGTYIWNNSESDPAVLYNAQGTQVSRYP